MPKTILYLLLILSTQLSAQITIQNTSLTKPNVAYLYIGLTNVIQLNGAGVQNCNLTSSAGSSISKDGKTGQFHINVNYTKQTDTLKVVLGNKVVYSKAFEIRRLNEVKARVGNIQTERATVATILVQPFLTVYFVDAIFKMPMHIVHFTFHSESGATSTPEIRATGAYFNADIIACIKALKRGAIIYFDNIVVIGPDSTGRTIGSIKLIIQ